MWRRVEGSSCKSIWRIKVPTSVVNCIHVFADLVMSSVAVKTQPQSVTSVSSEFEVEKTPEQEQYEEQKQKEQEEEKERVSAIKRLSPSHTAGGMSHGYKFYEAVYHLQGHLISS